MIDYDLKIVKKQKKERKKQACYLRRRKKALQNPEEEETFGRKVLPTALKQHKGQRKRSDLLSDPIWKTIAKPIRETYKRRIKHQPETPTFKGFETGKKKKETSQIDAIAINLPKASKSTKNQTDLRKN